VLLIEDDPAVRSVVARGLRRAGFACLEAASGEVGLDFARQRAPDLLLTDIEIPGKDGLAVLREFREDHKLTDVPAIIITGHPPADTAETIGALRAHILAKPFSAAAVVREVERLIGKTTESR
jgi:DNA-binding response OmpR family regulator